MQEEFESILERYPVRLDNFEGPLDLLLHLIKRNEVNIYDIPIHTITQQYLEYIDLMQELNLDVAGEFLVMAATLIHIKSRMLLPRADPQQEDPEEDPREALVRRLLEHQKFKAAAELLHERETLRSAQWTRPDGPIAEIAGEPPEPEIEVDLFSLISAFKAVVERAKQRPKLYLPSEQIPIEQRIEQLMARLSEAGFIHYEISNWAKPGFAAVHNSNYWKQVPYLGIGPSAHAFDGKHRFWNIANNAKYMNAFQQDQPLTAPTVEMETLSITDRFNEYIMTSLRTIWGIDMHYVKNTFPLSHWGPMEIALNRLEKEGRVNKSSESEKTSFGEANTVFTLTNSGKLIADRIASDLFFT